MIRIEIGMALAFCLLSGIPTALAVTVSSPIYESLWTTDEWPRMGYVLTAITGNQNGTIYVGGRDQGLGAFVAAYDTEGALIWKNHVYSGTGLDHIGGIDIDAAGNVFVAGETYRIRDGAFVAKFAPNGETLWVTNVGSSENDFGRDVAVDGEGNAFLIGTTTGRVGNVHYGGYDTFLTKITPDGYVDWIRQYDDHIVDSPRAIEVDASGSLIVAGHNTSSPGAVIIKFDSEGYLLSSSAPNYTTISGRGSEHHELIVDEQGSIYTVGSTNVGRSFGSFEIDLSDAFVAKHDNDGNLLWHRLLPGSPANEGLGIALRADGGVYVSGITDVRGEVLYTNKADAFLAGFGSNGDPLWYQEFGTEYSDYPVGVYIDEKDRLFVAGFHWDFFSSYGDSGFIARFDPIPEPPAVALLGVVVPLAVMLATCRRHRST